MYLRTLLTITNYFHNGSSWVNKPRDKSFKKIDQKSVSGRAWKNVVIVLPIIEHQDFVVLAFLSL